MDIVYSVKMRVNTIYSDLKRKMERKTSRLYARSIFYFFLPTGHFGVAQKLDDIISLFCNNGVHGHELFLYVILYSLRINCHANLRIMKWKYTHKLNSLAFSVIGGSAFIYFTP